MHAPHMGGSHPMTSLRASLQPQDGALTVFTSDGTEPTRNSQRFESTITLTKPYPRALRAMAIARCKYVSEVVTVELPGEAIPKQARCLQSADADDDAVACPACSAHAGSEATAAMTVWWVDRRTSMCCTRPSWCRGGCRAPCATTTPSMARSRRQRRLSISVQLRSHQARAHP